MATGVLRTDSVEALRRSNFVPGPFPANTPLTSAIIERRKLFHIKGVGRLLKVAPTTLFQRPERVPAEDLLIGLYGYRVPLAFLIRGYPHGVAIHLGTWTHDSPTLDGSGYASLVQGAAVLESTLRSLHRTIDSKSVDHPELTRMARSGFVLGVPTFKQPDPFDGALPMDRLLRAMYGASWACLVLAEPVPERDTIALSRDVINTLRAVQQEAQAAAMPSPLAQYYTELLQLALKDLTDGQAEGTWRTAVYLLGDNDSYPRLASVWRGLFAGDNSLVEPVRAWESNQNLDAGRWAVRWAMPNLPGDQFHPYQYQTLLSSSRLVAYVHLPQVEIGGFSVTLVPDFDLMPPALADGDALTLGNVIQGNRETNIQYAVTADELTRHVFIAGITGAGKTTTIFQILRQTARDGTGTPFLVIEPAKREYRVLLNDRELGSRLQVFTVGNERIAPLRLNPFEVLDGTSVGEHLDLLRSVFSAAFGMWNPLPQILEQCMHLIYRDRGWDTTADTNPRLDPQSDRTPAFPTLSDLVAKVDEVIQASGYAEEIKSNMRAALRTRLEGLRTGGKGRMFDVQHSLPMAALLEKPTVLELEGMGDDDDKAFMMGLLLIRLYEYRRSLGGSKGRLKHLLIIEEAHRLLTNVSRQAGPEEGNPRGKAVESFAHLLSEVRHYGQGIIIADQVPVRLAPDVIKNTNLKIAHRIVAEDDRRALGGAMAMNDRQIQSLATLEKGHAAIFTEGDDAPVLVHIVPPENESPDRQHEPNATSEAPGHTQNRATDQAIERDMAAWRTRQGYDALYLPLRACAGTCSHSGRACLAAREIIESAAVRRTFARLIVSTIVDTQALDRLWTDLLMLVQSRPYPNLAQPDVWHCLIVRAAEWLAQHRGAQAGWNYRETEQFEDAVRQLLLAYRQGGDVDAAAAALRSISNQLFTLYEPPLPGCPWLCQRQPGQYTCLYRHAAADLIGDGVHTNAWEQALVQDIAGNDGRYQGTWEVCQDAGYDLSEFYTGQVDDTVQPNMLAASHQACMCFGQQMLMRSAGNVHPRTLSRRVSDLLRESNQEFDDER